MLFGDAKEFAIEAEVEETSGRWVLGRLVFLVPGAVIGDREDAADLRGCKHWMCEFLARPADVAEPDILQLSPSEFFSVVFDPVMARGSYLPARYPEAFRRFSISQLGMSSFDRFDVLLLGLPDGGHRLLWREAEGEAQAWDLAPGVFCKVVAECVQWMDTEFTRD